MNAPPELAIQTPSGPTIARSPFTVPDTATAPSGIRAAFRALARAAPSHPRRR